MAYDSSRSSSSSDDDLTSNSSEDDHDSNKSLVADIPSWEVLEGSDSDSRPISDVTFTPPSPSKQKQYAEDWILEPDNDRDSREASMCLPVIESIISLGTADKEAAVTPVKEAQTQPAWRGQLRHNDSAMSGEDSDRLVIDMSTSNTDMDVSDTQPPVKGQDSVGQTNQRNRCGDDTGVARQSRDTGTRVNEVTLTDQNKDNNELCIKDMGGGQVGGPPPAKTGGNMIPGEHDKNDESLKGGCSLVISAVVQGSVLGESSPSENGHSVSVVRGNNNNASRQKEASISNSIPETPSMPQGAAALRHGSRSRSSSPCVKRLIVIDPEGPDDESDKFDLIDFQPGIIKLETSEVASSKTLTIPTNPSVVSMTSTSSNISTSASLSAATSLSSASQHVKLTPTNQMVQFVPGQSGPRTIVRASPKKPMPQVLVRHAGAPGTRPSYIRLGSQALQHFARMTSPPTPHGMQANQQRMISVLMDRGPGNTITTSALPPNFSQLLQAAPPGTLVNTGNPNNPVKVLIIPSQANNTGQVTQTNLQLTASATPLVSSAMGPAGTLGLGASPKIGKSNQPAPKLKSVSQMLGSALSKATTTTQQTQSGGSAKKTNDQSETVSKLKGQTLSKPKGQSGGSKSQGQGAKVKSKKAAPQDKTQSGDMPLDILQTMAVTEDRLKRRMLSKTNVIKEYHPSLSSGLGMVSFEFYSCHGCRDVFVNKSSLQYHKSRQSMTITYVCDPCKFGYTFSNKCQFRCHMLKHVQELKNIHKNLLERISIKPIQYALSKSGKPEDCASGEGVATPSPVPFEPSASKAPSPPTTGTAVGKEKVMDKQIEKASTTEKASATEEPGDSGSALGITISSVMSLDLLRVPQSPAAVLTKPEQVKVTVAEPVVATPPPPLTFAKAMPVVLTSTPLGPTRATADSPKVGATLSEQRAAASVHKKMKSGSISPPLSANTPPSEKSVQSISLTALQPPLTPQGPPGEGGNIFCTECSSTFSSYMKLQRHFNDADKPHPLRPPCCNARLATECCVRVHMRTHQNQRPFVCGDCGECFRGELAIYAKHTFNCKRVMNSAVMVFPCPRCQQWYCKIDELRQHIRDEHSESYLKCNLCPMAFKSVSSFKEHNANKHPIVKTSSVNYTSIHKCPLCDSVFHDQQMKLDHLEQHMNSIYANQRVSFVCQKCNKLCYNYASMRFHLKDKHMVAALGNMCDICGVDCGATIKDLVKHQRKLHNTFPANMLVDPFMQRPTDNDTTKVVTKEPDGRSDGVVERDGDTRDSNGSLLSQDGEPSSPRKPGEGGDNLYHRDLARKSSLYNQAEKQTGEDCGGDANGGDIQVTCHICRQTFDNRVDLVRHKKVDHGLMKRKRVSTNSRASPTEDQNKKVKQDDKDLLDETTAQFQVKSKYMLRFECDNCDYRTPTYEDLQLHQVEEHNMKARFPCLLCGITYQNKANLEDHMKATHEGQIREYAYICWICIDRGQRKGYAKRMHLVRHLMSFHKIASKLIDNDRLDEMERKADLSAAEKLEEQKIDDGQDAKRLKVDGEDSRFSCVKCDFECLSRHDFQEHIAKHKRGGTESYQCPECGMCFSVLPPLKNHLRLVHKIKNFTQYMETTHVKLKPEPQKNKPAKKSVSKASIEASSSNNPLECTVCYRLYQDQTTLKNHMRSHGMAFIRSKRLAPLAFLND